jgi:hypothetical protein
MLDAIPAPLLRQFLLESAVHNLGDRFANVNLNDPATASAVAANVNLNVVAANVDLNAVAANANLNAVAANGNGAVSADGTEEGDDETQASINYEECYSVSVFSDVAGRNFRNVDGVYIQTYGGGPEGGYLFSANGNTYEVNREWFQPFTMEEIEGNFNFVVNSENPNLLRMLRDDEEPNEDEQEFDCSEWHDEVWERAQSNYEEALLGLDENDSVEGDDELI